MESAPFIPDWWERRHALTDRYDDPPLRLILIWDNLAGHKSTPLVHWLCAQGILPLYTGSRHETDKIVRQGRSAEKRTGLSAIERQVEVDPSLMSGSPAKGVSIGSFSLFVDICARTL
jgi:hypothetical protein